MRCLYSAVKLRNASSRKPKRSEEHTSELQSHSDLVCRLLLEKKTARAVKMDIGGRGAPPTVTILDPSLHKQQATADMQADGMDARTNSHHKARSRCWDHCNR